VKKLHPTSESADARGTKSNMNRDQTGGASGLMPAEGAVAAKDWKQIVIRYQQSSRWLGIWQIISSIVPLIGLWYLIYLTVAISWWIALLLAMLAGGFLVRVFIIHHDCGHGSFFKSRKANDVWGFITGVLTFTPYQLWRREHAAHHSASGDLDRRGVGSLWTLTVQEYLEASRWKRFAYRLARNPFVLFVVAPLFLFIIQQRFAPKAASLRERRSVYWTNLAILGMAAGLSLIFGLKAYLIIQLTMFMVAGSAGVWLFYVQHQFEGVYWQRHEQWDYLTAALQGSSFYRLPRILQWFTGNIGFHHIHHLSPRIPNYNLERCHRAEPLFQSVPSITLFASLKSLTFRLWDEKRRRLVGFSYLRHLRRRANIP
jgi:omega-6 fatty acid desaturase (delta-12 desaturase)